MWRRKKLALAGLIVFVAGTLLVPVIHRIKLSHAAERATISGCYAPVRHSCKKTTPGDGERPGSEDLRSGGQCHDPSKCRICQLAKTPAQTAVPAVAAPCGLSVTVASQVTPLSPDFHVRRFLHLSRGPPS